MRNRCVLSCIEAKNRGQLESNPAPPDSGADDQHTRSFWLQNSASKGSLCFKNRMRLTRCPQDFFRAKNSDYANTANHQEYARLCPHWPM